MFEYAIISCMTHTFFTENQDHCDIRFTEKYIGFRRERKTPFQDLFLSKQ